MRLRSLISRLTDALVGLKPMKAMARHARFNALFMEDLKIIKKAVRRQVFAKNTNKALQEPILAVRSEEHTSELQSLMRISYAVFCLKKKKYKQTISTIYK